MRKPSIYLVLLLLVFTSCINPAKQTATGGEKQNQNPEEERIKKAVNDAYKAISFKQGESPDYNGIRNHFIPQAQFLNFRNDSLEVLTLDRFISAYKGFIESTGIKSFDEEELYGRTDQYGRIAQRISSYKSYINTTDTIGQRGVNSFQLVKTAAGWRVSSIIWDVEKPGQPIPNYYLDSPRAQ